MPPNPQMSLRSIRATNCAGSPQTFHVMPWRSKGKKNFS